MSEKNKSIVYIGCVLLSVCLIGLYLSFRPAGNNSDRGLENVAEQQQRAVCDIKRAEEHADRVTDGIADAIQRTDHVSDELASIKAQLSTGEEFIADSERRIARLQKIIREAKKQGSKG